METITSPETQTIAPNYQVLSGVIAIVECSEPSLAPDAPWQSFIVESGSNKKRIRCIGDIQDVVQGEVVKLSGHFHSYGDISSYFEIRHCESRQPTEPESIISYLLYLTNEPLQAIRKLINDMGESPSLILDGPEDLIWGTVNGVAEHTVKSCIDAWKSRINNGYVLEIAERLGLDSRSLDLFRLKIGDSNSIDTIIQNDPFLLYYHGVAPYQRCLTLSFELGYKSTSDQVFTATVYRTLINKYNNSNNIAFSIDEIIPNVFRALGISAKDPNADRLKMDAISIIKELAGDFIVINERMLAISALHKKEDFVINTLKKGIHTPIHTLPELDPEMLSDVCAERFNMDHSVAVYEVISNFEPVSCNIVNCSFGGLSQSILEITTDVFSIENNVYIVCPDNSHQLHIEDYINSNSTVIAACKFHDEFHPDSKNNTLIVYGAHSFDTSQWHTILTTSHEAVKEVIIIGDDSLLPPNGHGAVFHHLMTDRVFSDYILDTYDAHHPSISRKDEIINKLKKNLGVSLAPNTDFRSDLLIDKMEDPGFESLVNFYTTKVATHFNKDPHKDIEIRYVGIDDHNVATLNSNLVASIYKGSGIIQGKHIAKRRISSIGVRKGESVVVTGYNATHINIERNKEIELLPINQYSELASVFINPLNTYTGSYAWLNLLIVGSGDVSNATLRHLLSYLAGCEKCIIAGDFSSIDRLIRNESNVGGLLSDLGFNSYSQTVLERKKQPALDKSANENESDIISFD